MKYTTNEDKSVEVSLSYFEVATLRDVLKFASSSLEIYERKKGDEPSLARTNALALHKPFQKLWGELRAGEHSHYYMRKINGK